MKAVIHSFSTSILPTKEEVKELCRPGEGADSCIWLVAGSKGFECCCHNKPPYLLNRWQEGKTNAKRDGCEKVNTFDPVGKGLGEVEF